LFQNDRKIKVFFYLFSEAKKGNAWMTIFEDFPHGFLHFDTDIMPNQYVREAYNYIQELLLDILKELSGSS